MDENLPEEFDVVIVGTGLQESVLSGALSRVGKRVLHFDPNNYYGLDWASFSTSALQQFLNQQQTPPVSNTERVAEDVTKSEDGCKVVKLPPPQTTICDGEVFNFLPKRNHAPSGEVADASCKGDAASERKADDCEITSCGPEVTSCDPEVTSCDPEVTSCDPEVTSCDPEVTSRDAEVPQETSPAADHAKDSVQLPADVPTDAVAPTNTDAVAPTNSDAAAPTNTDAAAPTNTDAAAPTNQLPTQHEFDQLWRHFNIDLTPKVLFSRGIMVEMLIKSNVSRYLEFRNVTRTLAVDHLTNLIQSVPCSRADVFACKFISMIEKRILMKFLTTCAADPDVIEHEHADKPFRKFLALHKLNAKLQDYVIHSIAMVTDDVTTEKGVRATRKFLGSLGRYGNSAFLWPTYGCGELPQAFSRLSAVFGATFCLNRTVERLLVDVDTGRCTGVVDTRGQKIRCGRVIMNEKMVSRDQCTFKRKVLRAVYVTNRSVVTSPHEHVSVMTIPPRNRLPAVRLFELGPQSCVCPNNYYLVHAVIPHTGVPHHVDGGSEEEGGGGGGVRASFVHVEEVLFRSTSDQSADEGEKPTLLWASYFSVLSGSPPSGQHDYPENVHITQGPDFDLGFDQSMLQARELFEKICPDEEFLLRAPDPDQILFGDDDDVINVDDDVTEPEVTSSDFAEAEGAEDGRGEDGGEEGSRHRGAQLRPTS